MLFARYPFQSINYILVVIGIMFVNSVNKTKFTLFKNII